MKLLALLIVLSSTAFAFEMEPLKPLQPFKPIVFKPMEDPANYPEGISFSCKESNGHFLLFRNEKRTTRNGVQFQSQSILTFDLEKACLDQAEQLNNTAQDVPASTGQSQQQ